MIDARVEEAVRQHRQKMDWLHTEVSGEGGASAGGAEGKMGFTLPHGTPPPQAFSGNLLEVDFPLRDRNMWEGPGNGTKSKGSSVAEGKPEGPPPKEGTPV